MELFKGLLTVVFLLNILKGHANAQSKEAGRSLRVRQDKESRQTLNTVLEQNRRLVLQNNRLQQVWLGMQQMCKAITTPKCDCSVPQTNTSSTSISKPYKVKDNRVTKTSVPHQPSLPLQVMSIQSSGVSSGPTTLTIVYAATSDHTTEWISIRENGGMWRTTGKRTQNLPASLLYTSTIDVQQLQAMGQMFFRLYNDDESVNLRFNLTEIGKHQKQNVIAPTAGLLEVNSSYMTHLNSDLNITAIVNKNARDFNELADIEVFFTGLNTSAGPPAIFEIMNFHSDGIGLSMSHRTETSSNMDITLRYSYVQYGGVLTVRIPYRESMTGMVEELYYGPFIKVYASDTNEVVPNGSMGIFPLARQTIVFPPTQSLICAAMGNPRPNVTVLRLVNGSTTKEVPTETVILDSYMNMKVLTMSAKQPRKTEGRYICRATNGKQKIDAPTEVIVLNPAVFDKTNTGVVKRTGIVVVISCKARGKPKPKLALRLYDEYGPDLTQTGMYEVWKSDPNRFTSRVTLTISAIDDREIHTVFCTSSQGGPNGTFDVNRRINVFPEKESNLELYQRMKDSQVV